MRMNQHMRGLLAGGPVNPFATELPCELQDYVEAGWMADSSGALLLSALARGASSTPVGPAHVAEREYEVNDVYVPNADLVEHPETYLLAITLRGLSFAARMLERAQGSPNAKSLVAAVSTGVDDDFLTHGTTVKFFTRRGDYPQWFNDLERFGIEAMAVLDSSDLAPG